MQQQIFSAWRALSARTLGIAAAVLIVAGCSRGDVGAPCHHGQIEPPGSQVVTFPATSCDQLLCIYGDEEEAPRGACTPGDDDSCNPDATERKFECVPGNSGDGGVCRLRPDYVLRRSMCSKKCSSDEDCNDTGVGSRVVVDDTNCGSGFACAIIQTLGSLCCQGMCVCRDDLGENDEVAEACRSGKQEGCCVPPAGEDDEGFTPSPACGG